MQTYLKFSKQGALTIKNLKSKRASNLNQSSHRIPNYHGLHYLPIFWSNALNNTFYNTKGDSKLNFFSKHTRNGVITLLEGDKGGGKEKKWRILLLFPTTKQPLTDFKNNKRKETTKIVSPVYKIVPVWQDL